MEAQAGELGIDAGGTQGGICETSEINPSVAQLEPGTLGITDSGGLDGLSSEGEQESLFHRSSPSLHALQVANYAADFSATNRNDRKPARTSSENSCGCSQAAKCPPLARALKWMRLW